MVNAEDEMGEASLGQVEQPESHEQRADEGPEAPPPALRADPDKEQTAHRQDPGGGMEEAVDQRIEFKVADGGGRKARTRHHVVPLQDLVEEDSVDEAAKP
jgi:hypothetical protein